MGHVAALHLKAGRDEGGCLAHFLPSIQFGIPA
ncbi:rCG23665 [Rattus norvegicus]|uniref:RCG23665 n=1 Tax=Rattus norvegicus TaxID=10116 RepID=A6KJP3_RAT|nr:rCG23665 [Rattus norvegicus]